MPAAQADTANPAYAVQQSGEPKRRDPVAGAIDASRGGKIRQGARLVTAQHRRKMPNTTRLPLNAASEGGGIRQKSRTSSLIGIHLAGER